MDVVFLPDFTEANPYQSELADGLDERDVDVICNGFRILSVLRSVWNRNPDVIHFHWLHPYILGHFRTVTAMKIVSFFVELYVSRLVSDTKVVWTVHNLTEHEQRWPRVEIAAKRLFVNRFCDGVIAHCRRAREKVHEEYGLSENGDNVAVIPHGNYIDWYENTLSQTEARERLGISQDRHVILNIGSIRPYKQVGKLIEEFKRTDLDTTDLLIAGRPRNGEMESDIREHCRNDDRIRFHSGFIPADEIQVYLNASDVVVTPYRDILTSGTVLLAMSFGKAIIAPKIGCLPETIPDDGGILYNPDDPEALRRSLERIPREDLTEMGDRNQAVAETLDWDDIAKKTKAVYTEVAGEND